MVKLVSDIQGDISDTKNADGPRKDGASTARMRFAVAMATGLYVVVIGFVAIWLMVQAFGFTEYVTIDLSAAESPGVLAIFAAFFAAVRVKTWGQWRRWLVPLGVTTLVLAICVMTLLRLNLERQGLVTYSSPESPISAECGEALLEAINEADELLADYDQRLAEAIQEVETNRSVERPSWASGSREPNWTFQSDTINSVPYTTAYLQAERACE